MSDHKYFKEGRFAEGQLLICLATGTEWVVQRSEAHSYYLTKTTWDGSSLPLDIITTHELFRPAHGFELRPNGTKRFIIEQ